MEEKRDNIINIDIEQIYPHLDNPRKEIGDVTELAESIKKNGIMQNLTVIPGHHITSVREKNDMEDKLMAMKDRDEKYWELRQNIERGWSEDGYTLLIGHRRHAAAKLAGVSEVPCRIVYGMSVKEQVSTMLEENMQRNDLTIYEQAQGFQMMLDLGETEETIAEKTGFSKTTIRHRLNIAKLDQAELKKKDSDDGFQLTLKDLYELEKIKDVKTRNKILKESSNSRDLVIKAHYAVAEARRMENAEAIIDMLEKEGVLKAPKKAEDEMYSGKWDTVKRFELDDAIPKRLGIKKETEQMYYIVRYNRTLHVIKKAKKEKKELSEYEIKQKEMNKSKKEIKAILKESTARRKEFIQNIISGKIAPVKDEDPVKDMIWQTMVALGSSTYESTMINFFLEKGYYESSEEEKDAAKKKVGSLCTLHQMMIVLHNSMSNIETYGYNLDFNKSKGEAMQKGYEALKPYGWYFESEDEEKVIDGTHELYVKKE